MKPIQLLLFSVLFFPISYAFAHGSTSARLGEINGLKSTSDTTTVDKLDSLLIPFVNESRSNFKIVGKEEAHLISEQLLFTAASGLSNANRANEDVLASLVASLVSQRIKEEFHLVNDLFYAVLFQDQAIYYSELGFHERALEKEKRAMSIISSNTKSPDYDYYYPDELERLADRYHNLHNLKEAINYQTLANEFYYSHSLLDYYGCGLFKRARYFFEDQDYPRVIDDFNGFLSAMKKAKKEIELDDMHELLSDRGASYIHIGDFKNALKDAEANIEVSQLLFGPNSLEYSNSLSNYASVLSFLDEHFKAKEYFVNSLAILNGKPEWGYDYMITCDQYSITLIELGEYNEAKKYSDKAIDYCLQKGIRDYDYAQALINASRCASFLGDYESSYQLSKEALQVEKDLNLPEDSKNYGFYAALSSYAQAALNTDRIEDAEAVSITILSEGESKNISAFINSYIRLSSIELGRGNTRKALDYVTRALNCAKEYPGIEMNALAQLANCYLKTGQYELAAKQYSECIIKSKQFYGNLNLTTLDYKMYYCYTLHEIGDRDSVIKCVKEINEDIKSLATKSLLGMTSREKYFFLERLSIWSDRVLPLITAAYGDEDFLCELYDAILYNKGLLLIQERISNIAMHQEDSLYNQVKEFQRQYLNKLEAGDYNSPETQVLLAKRERIEKSILSNIQTDQVNSLIEVRSQSSWEGVRKKLSDKDLAIEVFTTIDSMQIYHYYALLLRANCPYPKLIHLFCENELPEPPSIRGGRPTKKELDYYSDYFERLYSLVWQPLDTELKGIKRVYFSPARKLYVAGVENATVKGKSLSERISLNRVSSTLFLKSENKPCHIQGLALLFGGLNMDASMDDYERPESRINTSGMHLPKFSDISQSTLEEVTNIQDLLNKKRIPSSLWTSTNGTEMQFKTIAENDPVEIIHVATHGLFYTNGLSSRRRKNDSPSIEHVLNQYNGNQLAMQHSALALSGANNYNRYEEDNNGLLTAREVSELNIPGLKITILSACQTGLGESGFDGVYGLQRGFKIAGSESVIMSLWDVDSEVTTDFMSRFYQEWLKGNQKEEAFRKAKNKIKSYNPNPYYWASFIMLD